jgi:hypothetical protein
MEGEGRRGKILISRDTTSSTPKPSFSPFPLTKRFMISSNCRLHAQSRPLEKITSLSCSKCSFILIIHFLNPSQESQACATPLFHTFCRYVFLIASQRISNFPRNSLFASLFQHRLIVICLLQKEVLRGSHPSLPKTGGHHFTLSSNFTTETTPPSHPVSQSRVYTQNCGQTSMHTTSLLSRLSRLPLERPHPSSPANTIIALLALCKIRYLTFYLLRKLYILIQEPEGPRAVCRSR